MMFALLSVTFPVNPVVNENHSKLFQHSATAFELRLYVVEHDGSAARGDEEYLSAS